VFISGGMAMAQISAAEIYTQAISLKDINIKKLKFSTFPAW
jgi:hypothetical protein